MTKPVEVTDRDKFELEFVNTPELCYIAQQHKAEMEDLQYKMKRFGESHPEYGKWRDEKRLLSRRRIYVLGRIKSRQMSLL